MPELPEVETVRRTLKNFILNKKITSIDVLYPKIIEDDIEEFKNKVCHQVINDIDRIGKFLIFKLDEVAFISHLRMEGKYHYVNSDEPLNKHDHIIFNLDDGKQLRYNDTRKFGRMKLVSLDNYANELPLSKLGPEPFYADEKKLYEKLHKCNLPIKHALLDQSIIAGIGNIYANEICFAMRLDPYTPTIHSFSANGIDGLFQVKLKVHMQKKCSVCGGEITKEAIKGRGTYYCKECQKRRR